jgi:hypothetical protein
LACETTDKRVSYTELLSRLELHDIPESKRCAGCGQNMHPIQLNKYIVFFIHSPDQYAACVKANPTGNNTPLIWCNKHMIRKQLDVYYKEVTGKEAKTR